jgi:hypothetical protein
VRQVEPWVLLDVEVANILVRGSAPRERACGLGDDRVVKLEYLIEAEVSRQQSLS